MPDVKRWPLYVLLFVAVALVATYQLRVWPFLGPKHVQIVNSDGDPVWGAVLYLQRPGESKPDFTGVANSGDGWIEIPRERIRDDAVMRATGPACGIVSGDLPSDSTLRLPAGRRITLRIPGEFPLPREPLFLSLTLAPVGEAKGWDLALQRAVAPPDFWSLPEMDRGPGPRRLHIDAAKRSIELLVPRGGKWQVLWSIMRYEGSSGSGTGPADPIEIEIADGATEVDLPLTRQQMLKYVR